MRVVATPPESRAYARLRAVCGTLKMPAMGKSDPHRFDDLFQEFGPIALKRFFGGEGIYSGDVMIGMIFSDVIYFKTDEETRKAFLAARTKPFSFKKHSTGETVVTGWFALPDHLYDDPDELAGWARAAYKVASVSPTAARKQTRAAQKRKPAARKRKA